ncbi:L-serine ammonia-lyase, iron-sulfur-dependent, subunit beta [Lottiidibacillus patelloidae]|uniref:L-serine deaminase n=1 Tax=Lottiidibacillus patelloidae TaxID=2670334 RepID=A0A263BYB4_9BACI|nr:L-serine ammonia-lyase, iron-sulfur-dependent subunit beta [Lottiidibacillus patelloidae]OZM58562.1 L-serine ammonia-lyase, iron-sulfur-dependent, subunit beta [Lottiidibacillus patelloidae]
MKYKSVFDIIGPVMIGPSSSHTAGAARIGRIARSLFGREPKKAVITFYGSFAKTYKGHGTDVAIVGGILDFDTSDERIIKALEFAKNDGIVISIKEDEALTDHPNTARIHLSDEKGEMELVGISIGGGKVEIVELNGYKLRLTGVNPALLVVHQDTFGVIASVTNALTKHEVNIGYMEVYRQDKGKEALMIIEVDQNLSEKIVQEVSKLEHVIKVIEIHD